MTDDHENHKTFIITKIWQYTVLLSFRIVEMFAMLMFLLTEYFFSEPKAVFLKQQQV